MSEVTVRNYFNVIRKSTHKPSKPGKKVKYVASDGKIGCSEESTCIQAAAPVQGHLWSAPSRGSGFQQIEQAKK